MLYCIYLSILSILFPISSSCGCQTSSCPGGGRCWAFQAARQIGFSRAVCSTSLKLFWIPWLKYVEIVQHIAAWKDKQIKRHQLKAFEHHQEHPQATKSRCEIFSDETCLRWGSFASGIKVARALGHGQSMKLQGKHGKSNGKATSFHVGPLGPLGPLRIPRGWWLWIMCVMWVAILWAFSNRHRSPKDPSP